MSWVKEYEINAAGELRGGLEDIGTFHEGVCWKLVLKNEAVWAICAPSHGVKE